MYVRTHTSLDEFLVLSQVLHLAQLQKGVDYTGNKLAMFMCSALPVLGEGREEERGGVVERRSQCGAAHHTSHSTQQTSRERARQVTRQVNTPVPTCSGSDTSGQGRMKMLVMLR